MAIDSEFYITFDNDLRNWKLFAYGETKNVLIATFYDGSLAELAVEHLNSLDLPQRES